MDITHRPLPPRDEMLRAFLSRDECFDGVFVTAVATTGIFCRPSCPARKPKPENVEFFSTARDALLRGFRPCLRCRPLEPAGAPPTWLAGVLAAVEAEPERRWRDADLRRMGLQPERVRRWFQDQHGMSFHAYARARRLAAALGQIRAGADVTTTALEHGWDSLSGFGEAFRRLFGTPPSHASDAPVLVVRRLLTPLGPMLAAGTDDRLALLEFVDRRMLAAQLERLRHRLGCAMVPGACPALERTAEQLGEYFSGTRRAFSLPLETPGTEFQKAVWERLVAIPYGATTTYGDLARDLGRPSAARAVARAVGDNRLALVIPCHRVIGGDGDLTGYGGGLWRKRRLLDHERRNAEVDQPMSF